MPVKIFRIPKILNNVVKSYRWIDSVVKNDLKIATTLSCHSYSSQSSVDLIFSKKALSHQLYTKIKTCGPITIADYMKEVLTNPSAGYYMSKDVFGEKGDFITSPEISQLFGEIIAVWIVNEWRKISSAPFQLVELGPGRGTLIQDILRVFKKLKLSNMVSVHLVEISPTLSSIQAKKLCVSVEDNNPIDSKTGENSIVHYRRGSTEDGVEVYWYYNVTDIPKKFSVFLAHEFFDALPIHKFQKKDDQWHEVLVDIIQETDEEKFHYVLSGSRTPAGTIYIAEDEKRDHIEVSPQSMLIIDYISTLLMEYGGFALIADYGHEGDKTDTFRAFQKHQLQDPLVNPGTADLTADVDFSLLKQVAQKDNRVISFGPISQREFLKNLGIDLRLKMILEQASEKEKKNILSGYHIITDSDKMGERFKFLSLFPYVMKDHLNVWSVDGFQSKGHDAD